jgi:hypothetical protein
LQTPVRLCLLILGPGPTAWTMYTDSPRRRIIDGDASDGFGWREEAGRSQMRFTPQTPVIDLRDAPQWVSNALLVSGPAIAPTLPFGTLKRPPRGQALTWSGCGSSVLRESQKPPRRLGRRRAKKQLGDWDDEFEDDDLEETEDEGDGEPGSGEGRRLSREQIRQTYGNAEPSDQAALDVVLAIARALGVVVTSLGDLEAAEGWADEARLERRLRLRELVEELHADGWEVQNLNEGGRWQVSKCGEGGTSIRALLDVDAEEMVRAEVVLPQEGLLGLGRIMRR